MSRFSDDSTEMSGVDEISDASASPPASPGGGEAASVTQFLLDLRALGEGSAPEPSTELAALLGGATPLATLSSRRWHVLRRAALIAAAVVAGTTVAAASHNLPQPAQRVVTHVVDVLTPFHIDPQPRHDDPAPARRPTLGDERPSRPALPSRTAEPGDTVPGSGGPGDELSAPALGRGSSGAGDDGSAGTRTRSGTTGAAPSGGSSESDDAAPVSARRSTAARGEDATGAPAPSAPRTPSAARSGEPDD